MSAIEGSVVGSELHSGLKPQPRLPPGPRTPRLVNLLNWVMRPLPYLEDCRARYGDIFTLKLAGAGTWVLLSDPEDIKRAFTGDPDVLRAGEANLLLRPVVGRNSSFTLDGPEHLRQRKLVLPPFHGERVQRYGDVIEEATIREIEQWPVGEPFALWPRMRTIALDIIVRAVFGVTDTRRSAHMHKVLGGLFDWLGNPRKFARILYVSSEKIESDRNFRAMLDPVDEVVLREISQRRAEPDLEQREDIMSMLVQARYEDGSPMSDQQLCDELKTMLLAGHDTTATVLSWTFELLMSNEDKLERMREEVRSGDGRAYLEAVVKEAQRLRTVIPTTSPRLLAQPMEFGGYTLPAGTLVAPCIHLIHHDERIYQEPRSFRPERFLEQSSGGSYTLIPFGGGVRRCVGAPFAQFELRKVIETIVREVDLRPAGARREKAVRRALTIAPRKGVRVVAARR
jgi:cytochrome P450